jgi:2-polyprenyl-3-methyl-5-hydroxy-6-metoxy-1,4-benzoquinol methylase
MRAQITHRDGGSDRDSVSRMDPDNDAAALGDRMLRNMTAALELYTVYLGERLGLYRALAEGGPATSPDLAARTGTTERYVREWLEQQAACGLLTVDDPAVAPPDRRFCLPAGHVPVLADPDDVRYRAHNGTEIARAARSLPHLVEAFRTGGAPPPQAWAPEGRPDYNRSTFLHLLGRSWLPAIGVVDERLRRSPSARVADLACGAGWSSIAIALAYPLVHVDGFDPDKDVIAAARRNAGEAGVADRVTFYASSADNLSGRYDVVTILEGLHDMARPVAALRVAREALNSPGLVVVADELVEDEFTAPASLLEQNHYGWSVVGCLPAVMGDPQTAATGAVMRPETLRRYATDAGFSDAQVLPVDAGTLRFYLLRP